MVCLRHRIRIVSSHCTPPLLVVLFLFLFPNKNRLPITSSRLRHWLARLLKAPIYETKFLASTRSICAKRIIHDPRTHANAQGVR